MPHIVLDFDPALDGAPIFTAETADLVYFLSWAFSARYGGNHEMSIASLLLRGECGIDLTPLLTFAGREIEMEADAEMLDRTWQAPGPLSACCDAVVAAFQGDDQRLRDLAREYAGLVPGIRDLGRIASWAAAEGLRMRVTFTMADAP